jgi:hypothetical protein
MRGLVMRSVALRLVLMLAALLVGNARAAEAQATHVLIITGLSGEPRFAQRFESAARAVYDVAKNTWKVADSSLIWLAEDPARDRQRIRARSVREEVGEAFLALSRRVGPGDVVVVLLMGHGSGERENSRVNLPGPDPTAGDYATWISGFARQDVVFVNASSGSGDFIDVLKGPGRVVLTATRSALERNESVFSDHFAKGLASGDADADKDGRISVLEAFRYAMREVERAYETAGTLRTERGLLSDSTLATRVSFGPPAAGADDPRVRALVAERVALEEQLAALRGRKATMSETQYEDALERLLVLIAEKSAEIRAAGGQP